MKNVFHLRKFNNKLFGAGKGTKNKLIGKLVWYKKNVYTVKRRRSNGTYDLVNLTRKLKVEGVPRSMFTLY